MTIAECEARNNAGAYCGNDKARVHKRRNLRVGRKLKERKTMKNYAQRKAEAREKAIDWQNDYYNHNYSYGELYDFSKSFERLAKRYGLIKEFRENGII